MRLLPWRPPVRRVTDDWVFDAGGFDLGDDIGVGLAIGLVILFLPLVITVLLFSAELLLVLALVPFLMSGQLLGLLPWQLALRTASGQKRYVSVRGTRQMLEARRYYRSLRVS